MIVIWNNPIAPEINPLCYNLIENSLLHRSDKCHIEGGHMAYNPYEYGRYQEAIRSSVRPGSIPPAIVSGTISLINEIVDTHRQAEEAMRRQWHEDQQGFLHSSQERALRSGVAQEEWKGLPDCTHDNWRTLTGD